MCRARRGLELLTVDANNFSHVDCRAMSGIVCVGAGAATEEPGVDTDGETRTRNLGM